MTSNDRQFVGRAALAILGIAKTCAKLGISFRDHLGSGLAIAGNIAIPRLPERVSD